MTVDDIIRSLRDEPEAWILTEEGTMWNDSWSRYLNWRIGLVPPGTFPIWGKLFVLDRLRLRYAIWKWRKATGNNSIRGLILK